MPPLPSNRLPAVAAPRHSATVGRSSSLTRTLTLSQAPALASYALLPLVSRFAKSAGIEVQT